MGIKRRLRPSDSLIPPWLDNDGFFVKGRYAGRSVERVAAEDPDYLWWILEQVTNIQDDDRQAIETALEFRNYRR